MGLKVHCRYSSVVSWNAPRSHGEQETSILVGLKEN